MSDHFRGMAPIEDHEFDAELLEERIKFISLFSGIGGFDLGFERAGMESVAVCDIDKHALGVLGRHFPHAKQFDDVRKIGVNTHERGTIGLICGGFPCQDVSLAGKRAGLDGGRSGLWFEFLRIITELLPGKVVIENVPGLLSSNGGRDMGAILGALSKLGYGWAYRVLDAQYFGLAQRRRRVFIVASLGSGCAGEILFERESSAWDTPPSREAREGVAGTFTVRSGKEGGGKGYLGLEDGAMTLGGQPQWVDQKSEFFGHSGGVTLKINEVANTLNGQTGSETTHMIQGVVQSIASGKDITETLCANYGTKWGLGNQEAFSGEYHVLSSFEPGITAREGKESRLNKEVCSTLRSNMGDNQPAILWHNHQQDGSIRIQKDTSPTVSKHWGTGGNNVPFVGVRRLTPLECERLQGFPDGWTDGQSDTQRYKQLGNAVAVPVAEWIGRRIQTQSPLIIAK